MRPAFLYFGSLVPMHRGFVFRVAHRHIDEERQEYDAGEIIIEPVLVSDALEVKRDGRCRAAEDRDRQDRVVDLLEGAVDDLLVQDA